MVIVDTSVWVSHLRQGNGRLEQLLIDGDVLCHPFIIVEIACGNLKNRKEILSLLQDLPVAQVAEHGEVLTFVEQRNLFGLGIGLIDAHLLASALLTGVSLWTEDKRLKEITSRLRIVFLP